MFEKATRKKAKARIGLIGPSGAGKTYTALRLAMGLGLRVAVIDTEHGSASKYAGEVCDDGTELEFDVVDLGKMRGQFSVDNYLRAMQAAADAGYDVLVIDSLSHAWAGPGGVLAFVDAKSSGPNKFAAWRDATPMHQKLIDTILSSPCHIIATMRSKTEYVLEDVNGKKVPRKIGMAPVQRDGMEYEFDIVADLDGGRLTVSKTRCSALRDLAILHPGPDLAGAIREWLDGGEDRPAPAPAPHHPSWEEDRAWFCTAIRELGWEYDELAAEVQRKGAPRPSQMDPERRARVLAWAQAHPRTAGGAS